MSPYQARKPPSEARRTHAVPRGDGSGNSEGGSTSLIAWAQHETSRTPLLILRTNRTEVAKFQWQRTDQTLSRSLTSELSRVAARPQIGQAVAAKCAAAKQRRLERVVRLQCATKGSAALREQRPRSLTSRRVGERKEIGAKDLAEAWPRGQ